MSPEGIGASRDGARRQEVLRRCLGAFAVGLILLAALIGAISIGVARRRGVEGLWWPNGVVLAALVGLAFVHVKGAAAPSERWALGALGVDLVAVNAMAGWQLLGGSWEAFVLLAGIGNALGIPLLVVWSRLRSS